MEIKSQKRVIFLLVFVCHVFLLVFRLTLLARGLRVKVWSL